MGNKKRLNKSNVILFFIIVFAVVLGKVFQFNFLPEKYFYDSNHIINVMNGSTITDPSYTFTANFFNAINIFHFTTTFEWAIALSILMTPLLFFAFKKYKSDLNIKNILFIVSFTIIISIYTFNISKEVIQFLIFLLISSLIRNEKITNSKKIIISTAILLAEGILFRKYYIITALIFATLCIIYRQLKNKSVLKTLLILLPILIVTIFGLRIISENSYSEILNARTSTNALRIGSEDAVTIINDIIPNQSNSPIIFIQNYALNTFRILFPLELLSKGVKYIPFVIIQIALFFIVFSYIKSYKKNITIPQALFIIIAFVLTSILFEPDFGSVIRHESAILPILLMIFEPQKIINAHNIKDTINEED